VSDQAQPAEPAQYVSTYSTRAGSAGAAPASRSWQRRALGILRIYLFDSAVLLAAYLVATYWRKSLPLGKYVGANYQWQTPGLYLTIAAGAALGYALYPLLPRPWRARVSHRLYLMVASLLFACLGITIFLPRQSGLQKGYFMLLGLALIGLLVPWSRARDYSLTSSLKRLWANKSLLRIWVQYNIQSRYTQAVLGILWIVLLPLSTALVMTVVFAKIMRVPTGKEPFIAFFLAGFVPWGLFSQAISGSMRSILGSMGLMNQIYFPREIIVLSALGEALVDASFMFLAMVIIDIAVGVNPTTLYLLLPILLIIQVVFTLGLMFIVSWASVFVRDIPQLVSVLLQILFYLCPIIYPVAIVPHQYRFLITLNPIAVLIVAYRDIIVYARMPDWISLTYPAAFGIGLLVFGYRHFKTNEDRFADMM
jgi:ABC-type polysaccharide/polyol phosphate export permease